MAYRTDGSSALKYDDSFELNVVDEKIINISQGVTKNFNGNKFLENQLKTEIRSIINEEEIKTNREEIDDLAEIISKNFRGINSSEVKIEAKKIKIEIDKWKEENIKEVNDFRKEEFKNKFEEETKKLNPNLKADEMNKVKECGKLISDVYFDESIIENQKDEALELNRQQYSPGQLENAWTDLKGVTNFLKRKPEQIREIKEKYNSIKDGLKNIKLPNNLKEVRSFDKVISIFNNEGVSGLFNKTALKLGQNLIGKIGNQAVQEFAKNSLGVLAKEGFQKGITTLLKGVLSGGVKAAATTAGAAAVSATGVGAVAVVAMKAIKAIKDVAGKIAEKLGINTKKFFEENFGKVGGKIMNGIVSLVALPALLAGASAAVVIGPILIAIFVFLFVYQMIQGNLVSSLVPPKGEIEYENVIENEGSGGLVLFIKDSPEVFSQYQLNGITFYVFEENSDGGRMQDRYDLAFVDNGIWLEPVGEYALGLNNKLDKRAKEAYIAMVEAGIVSGQLSKNGDLMLISGYRSREEQIRLWNEALKKYGSVKEAEKWASNPNNGLSSHATGRAIDIVVNGGTTVSGGVENQKKSSTFKWLEENASNYGFYNYWREPWHWEYNPEMPPTNAL